ncbi:MAG: DNA polymerase III subunit alpha [Hyphomicrobiaceae bacterium]|nr:MAG: DNA polymerase III subunit alpha [Hyphomicrobiaceae bacterium]
MAARFVHLKAHSSYSLLEGALSIGALGKLAVADDMPALALTDTGNLFGVLEFSEKLAGLGLQPIAGTLLAVHFGDARPPDASLRPEVKGPEQAFLKRREIGRLALLAKNEAGFANLMRLVTQSYLDVEDTDNPHVTIARLIEHGEGLIVLSGGGNGAIDSALREGQPLLAKGRLERLKAGFGDRLYVEVQRHGAPYEAAVEPQLLDLAYALAIPIVASNEVLFAKPSDFEAHDALICIAEGRYIGEDNRTRLTRGYSFRTQEEMVQLFADLPEAVASTLEIARRCSYRPMKRKPILPRFVATGGANAKDQLAAEAAELKRQAEEGLGERLKTQGMAPGLSEADYRSRLAYEVEIISKMKFPGYFLIVSDFIKWAKSHGIPVGPGRGSGAGSVVAWSLTITDLDPLRFGLLFERFLNPERVSMPDFDIDFCQERRDEVIRYVKEKYGADRVAQIITHGKLQARAVLRDVGRVLQMPYGQVDKLCKLVPNNPANPVTLPEAIEGEPKLQEARDSDPQVKELLEISQKLEGLYRHASTHAAGIVIGDRPLYELVPLYRDPRSTLPATQFNMKWVEAAGLVKFDFLGLKTLTVIRKAVELLRARGINLDPSRLELDDERTFDLLSRADTAGVFQLEGTGMREALKRLRPDRFEDIIAMVSLYRPGPMDNIPTYINRKHGLEAPDYLHPKLEPVLKETYGVIIYQEQVQQIAQALAGYSLGEADLLRRAMGKKIKAEMAAQKTRFLDGAKKNGVDSAQADYIFELVNKFAGYGFNKSHAAAYALVSYQTAYLKANHAVEFFAASMTLDKGNTDKLAMFVGEARRSGVPVLPPSINASGIDFLPEGHSIRYALSALKNIGDQAVISIEAARKQAGAFGDLSDFASRFDPKAVNKRALEALAAAGTFDGLGHDRAVVYANVEAILHHAQRLSENAETGQDDLFGGGGQSRAAPPLDVRPAKPWLPTERLQKEFEAAGLYLSGHPLDAYQGILKRLDAGTWRQLEEAPDRASRVNYLAGIVTGLKERRSKTGNKFAFGSFSDQTGQFEAVIFSEVLARRGELLVEGTPVLLSFESDRDGESVKVRVTEVESLTAVANRLQKGLRIVVDARVAVKDFRAIMNAKGRGEVRLVTRLPLQGTTREIEIRLPGRFDVSPERAGALMTLPGVLDVIEL